MLSSSDCSAGGGGVCLGRTFRALHGTDHCEAANNENGGTASVKRSFTVSCARRGHFLVTASKYRSQESATVAVSGRYGLFPERMTPVSPGRMTRSATDAAWGIVLRAVSATAISTTFWVYAHR